MALKAILDNLDGISEEISKEYKKRDDGKYVLDVTSVDGFELAEVSKLQSALSKERENNRKSADQLKLFENLDPAKAREAMKKVEEMAAWTPEQKVKEQIEAVKASIIEAHGKEKAKLEEKLAKLTKAYEAKTIDLVAQQALNEQGCKLTKMPMLYIRQQTRLRESDGNFITEVLDDNKNPRVAGTDCHSMTIPELVTEMKTQNEFAIAFEGTGATGSGAGPSANANTNRNNVNLAELAKLPPQERLKKARELGIK